MRFWSAFVAVMIVAVLAGARAPSPAAAPRAKRTPIPEGGLPPPKQAAIRLVTVPPGAIAYAQRALGTTPRQVTIQVPSSGRIRFHKAHYRDCVRSYSVHQDETGSVLLYGNGEPQPVFGTDVPVEQMPVISCSMRKAP